MQSRLIAPIAANISNETYFRRPDHASHEANAVTFRSRYIMGLDDSTSRSKSHFDAFPTSERWSMFRPLLNYPSRFHAFCSINRGFSWPPHVRSGEEWLLNRSLSILPEGNGTTILMSHLHLPLVSIRLAVLGQQFLHACILLGECGDQSETVSESSWPETESSFLIVGGN